MPLLALAILFGFAALCLLAQPDRSDRTDGTGRLLLAAGTLCLVLALLLSAAVK